MELLPKIQELNERYESLRGMSPAEAQERGYLFEEFVNELMEFSGLESKKSFRTSGDQIDGAFKYRGVEYFLELKWTRGGATIDDIRLFHVKLRHSLKPGLLISVNGFAGEFERCVEGDPILLLAGRDDLKAVLDQKTSLRELLDVKLSAWPNEKFVPYQADAKKFRAEWDRRVKGCAEVTRREIRSLEAKYRSYLYINRETEKNIESLVKDDTKFRNLGLVIERAGSGKTNLLCYLAERYSRRTIVFFVRPGIRLNQTLGLPTYLAELYGQRDSQRGVVGVEDFVLDAAFLACSHGRKVVVLIDGINESRTPELLKEEVQSALARWKYLPIVLVLSCRDIYWSLFEGPEWEQWVYEKARVRNRMYHFSGEEYEGSGGALQRYLDHYKVAGRLTDQANERCRHPLLLTFFCKAYAGERVGTVRNIRLLELFQQYWTKKIEEPFRETHPRMGKGIGPGARYLLDIAREILKTRQVFLDKDRLPEVTGERDLERRDSTYLRLLDEDVVLEEETGRHSAVVVRFVYEEFMEYVIARHVLEETRKLAPEEVKRFVGEFIATVPGFLRGLGAMVFLGLMLKAERQIAIWRLLIKQSDPRWAAVIFDALRRLSEDGLDESTDELVLELMDKSTAPGLRAEMLDLCREPPYRGRAMLVDAIKRCLEATDDEVRTAAVRAMMAWPGSTFRKVLLALSGSADLAACTEIAECLAERAYDLNPAAVHELLDSLALKTGNRLRARTAMAMAAVGSVESLAKLRALVDGSSPKVKSLIADECRVFRDRERLVDPACDILERLCVDAAPEVALHAISMYGAYYQDRPLRFLMDLAASPAADARAQRALAALVNYAGDFCLAGEVDVPHEVREARIVELCRVCAAGDGDDHGLAGDVDLTQEESAYLIHLAAVRGGDTARRLFLPLISSRHRVDVLRVVLREAYRVADAGVVERVARLSSARSTQIRVLAIEALGKISRADAVEALIRLVAGREPVAANKGLEALFAQPNALVKDTLLEVIASRSLDETARERLATELRRLRPEVVRNALLRLATSDPGQEVKRLARQSLEAIESAP